MKRALWIVGLSIALLSFGGFVVLGFIVLFKNRHLSARGWTTVCLNAYATWFVFQRLMLEIRGSQSGTEPLEKPPDMPRLL